MKVRITILLLVSLAVCPPESTAGEPPSIARIWNKQLLEAIRMDLARPTVHARNLFHLSVAAWDAWAAWAAFLHRPMSSWFSSRGPVLTLSCSGQPIGMQQMNAVCLESMAGFIHPAMISRDG